MLMQGVSTARLESHGLRHFINRFTEMVERSEDKERLYQIYGDVLVDAPRRLNELDRSLDRTMFLLSKLQEDALSSRLVLDDKAEVQNALTSSNYIHPSARKVAQEFLALRLPAQDLAGVQTYTTTRSKKNLPSVTDRPVSDPEAYPQRALPEDSNEVKKDEVKKIPQPFYQKPSPVGEHGADDGVGDSEKHSGTMFVPLDFNRPFYEKPRTMAEPGDQYGRPVLEQGTTIKQRRPHIYAGSYYRLSRGTPLQEVIDKWQEGRSKPYSDSMPQWYSPRALWPHREYTWDRNSSRSGIAVVDGKMVDLPGPLKWDAIVKDMKKRGWDKDEPLYFKVGESGAKVEEGNHRLAIALKLNKKVPVVFRFVPGRVTKSPQHEPVEVPSEAVEEAVKDQVSRNRDDWTEEDDALSSGSSDETLEKLMDLFGLKAGSEEDEVEVQGDEERLARPKVRPKDRQVRTKGKERLDSKRYERSPKRRSEKKVYNKQYKRRYKNIIDKYNKNYYRNPDRHKRLRKAVADEYLAKKIAGEYLGTFYREELDPHDDLPSGQSDGVTIVDSETPGKANPLQFPLPGRSDGSAKVIPYNSAPAKTQRHYRTAATTVSEALQGLDQGIRDRSRGLSVNLRSRQGSEFTFNVKDYEVKVALDGSEFEGAHLRVACTCNFWRWQGPEHWAKKGGYLLGSPRGTATRPDVKDPRGQHKVCKHVVAALDHLQSSVKL